MVFFNLILLLLIIFICLVMIRPDAFLFLGGVLVAGLTFILFNDYFLFVSFTMLSLVFVYTVLARKEDIFAPWNIFMCVWLFAIGVCSLQITVFEKPWADQLWLAVLLGMFSFLIPSFILCSFWGKNNDLKGKLIT
jgi:hypothetical protein